MSSKSGSGDRRPEPHAVPSTEERVLVGEVVRPHGLRGDLKVEIHSDVEERFAPGARLLLSPRKGRPRWVRVLANRPTKGGSLLRFDGIDDRDQAEAVRGATLEVDRDQVPEAPDGCYYYFELVGCRCFDAREGDLGIVEDVVEDGGGTLLTLRADGRTLLVPFVDAFLDEVDTKAQRIDVTLPEGLVEACASRS